MYLKLFYVSIIILIFNIPFGYWRQSVRKFSLQWILAIHLPVPVIIALRFLSGLGFQFITYPALVGAFFLGQYIGAKIYKRREYLLKIPLTSCLIWDMINMFKNQL